MEAKCITASAVTYGNDADWSDLSEWQRKADGWTIALTNCDGESEEFWYWTGQGLRGTDPTVADLVQSLASDARYLMDEPEELTYANGKAIEKQTEKAKRLFGRDYWFRLTEMSEEEIQEIF